MDIDNCDESNGGTSILRHNGLSLRPVLPEESGEGLPYAPVNFPRPGDIWRWKVGKRVASNGYFLDRYLYLPKPLSRLDNQLGRKYIFASKLSVERYIRAAFPDVDVEAFFASFSWKIPSKQLKLTNGNAVEQTLFTIPSEEIEELSTSDSQSIGVACKAGNRACTSLLTDKENPLSTLMPCDICCSEPHFCRECCCILCCKTINLKHGGYSYLKCEAMAGEGYICGHVAHVNCALRSYMAGTVGGSIGLDAEYYCRRCDSRTDLVLRVAELLEICESINSRDDVEKVLNVCFCVLRNSQKSRAKELLNCIELAIIKLKSETSLEDIWKIDESNSAPCTGAHDGETTLEANHQGCLDLPSIFLIPVNYQNEAQKLEDEVYHVLQELKQSQETEYKIAEERLFSQQNYLNNLYQQLEQEKAELSHHRSTAEADDLLSALSKRSEQIKCEVKKLKEMEEVTKGFGRTSKYVLKEHFGLEIGD